jgi:3',5'-cyclic AMP phosphodiesterase CpdA
MLTILHGSDLHFGKHHDSVAAEAFLRSAREIGPDLIVLSGDFTQRAKVREYEEARRYLGALPHVPTVVTPGNHDVPLYRIWERLLQPYRNYRSWISPELDSVTTLDGATVVALNSAAPRRAIVNGRIRPHQLALAASALREAAPDSVRIVVLHHHLSPAPDYERDRPLPGAHRILDALEKLGVELILAGHLHRAYIGNSLDTYPGEDREHGIVIVQSGTTTSKRGRARERSRCSFNLVRVTKELLEISHFMYFEKFGGFAPFSMHVFPRREAQYFDEDPFGRVGSLHRGAAH